MNGSKEASAKQNEQEIELNIQIWKNNLIHP